MQATKTYCPQCDWIGEEDDIFCQQCGSKMERGNKKLELVSPPTSAFNNPLESKNAVTVDVRNESNVQLGFVLTTIGIGLIVIIGMTAIAAVLALGMAQEFTFFLVIGLIGIPFVGISTISENYRKTFRVKSMKTTTKRSDNISRLEITK